VFFSAANPVEAILFNTVCGIKRPNTVAADTSNEIACVAFVVILFIGFSGFFQLIRSCRCCSIKVHLNMEIRIIKIDRIRVL